MCWCHNPLPMEKQEQWANTAAWGIFVTGERSMDAANCQQHSKTAGLCPPPPPKPTTEGN